MELADKIIFAMLLAAAAAAYWTDKGWLYLGAIAIGLVGVVNASRVQKQREKTESARAGSGRKTHGASGN